MRKISKHLFGGRGSHTFTIFGGVEPVSITVEADQNGRFETATTNFPIDYFSELDQSMPVENDDISRPLLIIAIIAMIVLLIAGYLMYR